jgi:predicted DCC family thiol-disulfide oxidoreductase YuxK
MDIFARLSNLPGGITMNAEVTGHGILLFDGECNLCNHAVQFIIPRDSGAYYRFAALQSEVGEQILAQYQLSYTEMNTVILIQNGKIFTKSTAALKLVRHLNRMWPLLYVFIIIPRLLRDPIYEWVARNRYKWFGRREFCMMPSSEMKSRFLQ